MFEAFIAATSVALLSLIGVLFFGRSGHLAGTHRYVIPVALGVFIGVVFFELVPETLKAGEFRGSAAIVAGFLGFYLLSHFMKSFHHHHHNHGDGCEHRGGAQRLLVGDAIHNVADGVVIATAFTINPAIGIATTIGIALHEIPQEIAEYGVLVRAGYTNLRAAILNLISASSIILGVVFVIVLSEFGEFTWILTGIAAGNLLYIAASDMIPELHGDEHTEHFLTTFLSTLVGLIAIVAILHWTHENYGHVEHEEEHAGEADVLGEHLHIDDHANEDEHAH